MSLSNEWTDWHLTPRGWEAGTCKFDFGRTKKETPKDRVLTSRYSEQMSSAFSPIVSSVDEVWRDNDTKRVEQLLKKFGPCPQLISS
jgi:hypothetical protein